MGSDNEPGTLDTQNNTNEMLLEVRKEVCTDKIRVSSKVRSVSVCTENL